MQKGRTPEHSHAQIYRWRTKYTQ